MADNDDGCVRQAPSEIADFSWDGDDEKRHAMRKQLLGLREILGGVEHVL